MTAQIHTDRVVIVGAGLGALYAALAFAPYPVLVISPEALGAGASSTWAQGGVAAAMAKTDSPEAHANDTIAAGAGAVDPVIAALVTAEARQHVLALTELGTPFDRDAQGHYLLNHEAAHSEARVVRARGDQSGAKIMERLVAAVENTPSVQVLEGFVVTELIKTNSQVRGVEIIPVAGGTAAYQIIAPAVLLAAGGVGGLYAKTTNPPQIRGEALGLAIRAGAKVRDLEFVQFHPTAIDIGLDPCPLATEALRGEGGLLLNNEGVRFALAHDPRGELAPRDVVARAIFSEERAGRRPVLDVREAVGQAMAERFPTVTSACLRGGVDPSREPIPVTVAAHFHMGGVATDANGSTSLEGLWACGEVACTGLHGANRLASNGLLEALVFAQRAAADIGQGLCADPDLTMVTVPQTRAGSGAKTDPGSVALLRRTMSRDVGVVRRAGGLRHAITVIGELLAAHADDIRFINMCTAALAIAEAALARPDSCGSHFRVDQSKLADGAKHEQLKEPL